MIEDVINKSAGLIWKIAKSFYGIDKNDLYQAGVLGVIKAYQNYCNDGKTKFSTYAYNYIFGEMYNLASNKEIKLNKDVNRLLKMIEVGRMRLAQEILREPTNRELALYLEMDLASLEQILMYQNTFVSIDDEENKRCLHEVIPCKEALSEDERLALYESMNTLEVVEKDIIKSRYYEDLTQSETAKRLGLTQVMVSRYEKKGLKKMREFMYM